jgi:hypothetical protein
MLLKRLIYESDGPRMEYRSWLGWPSSDKRYSQRAERNEGSDVNGSRQLTSRGMVGRAGHRRPH